MNRVRRWGRRAARLFESCWPRQRREMHVSDDIEYVRLTIYDNIWRWMNHSDFTVHPETDETYDQVQFDNHMKQDATDGPTEEELQVEQHHIYEHDPDGDCFYESDKIPVELYDRVRSWLNKKTRDQVTHERNNREVRVSNAKKWFDNCMYEDNCTWLADICHATYPVRTETNRLNFWASFANWNDLVGLKGCQQQLDRVTTIRQLVSIESDPIGDTSKVMFGEDCSWASLVERMAYLNTQVSNFVKMVDKMNTIIGIEKVKRSNCICGLSLPNIAVDCEFDV